MIPADTPCDLCSLPVGAKPFLLDHGGQTRKFCCEGCLGIYQMLHDMNEIPAPSAQNTRDTP